MPRAEIVVDLDAIRGNVAHLAQVAAPAEVMAVVKADGYGHGIVEVARAAREGGAGWLGVATMEEALALRAAGDTEPILAWLSVPGEDHTPAIEADVELAAYSVAQVESVAACADAAGRPAALQLKVDTGLTRGGVALQDWSEAVEAARKAEEAGQVRVTGIWSHFACSDEPEHPANDQQERVFREALRAAADGGLRPRWRHLANSAATLTRPSARFDLVRCGLAMYGLSPAPTVHDAAGFGLRPAMTARARLALVKPAPAGAGISYGHTYRVPEAGSGTTVGVVPVGYGDGVLRSASSRAQVLVGGRRATIAGRVCMDQFVLDVGNDDESPRSCGCGRRRGALRGRVVGRADRAGVGRGVRHHLLRDRHPHRWQVHPPLPGGATMSRAQRIGKLALGMAGAGATGFYLERFVGRRMRAAALDREEPFGSLRGTEATLVADDGVRLHTEVDEMAPYAAPGKVARPCHRGVRARLRDDAGLLALPARGLPGQAADDLLRPAFARAQRRLADRGRHHRAARP